MKYNVAVLWNTEVRGDFGPALQFTAAYQERLEGNCQLEDIHTFSLTATPGQTFIVGEVCFLRFFFYFMACLRHLPDSGL